MISLYIDQSYYAENPYVIGGWKSMPCWPKSFLCNFPCQIYTDIDQYRQSDADVKIAFGIIDHRSPMGLSPLAVIQREKDQVTTLAEISDLAFIIETEVHAPALLEDATFSKYDNLYWILAGSVDHFSNKIIPWQYHIWRIAELYKTLDGALELLDPYVVKPKYFDAMLGMKKPHRSFVAEQIVNHKLDDKIVYALGPLSAEQLDVPMPNNPEFIWEPDFEPLPDMDYLKLNQHIKYRGQVVQMPCVIPTQLFNATAYSIICETGSENHTHMLSEKTAKAFIGRRLFVMFSGAGILKFIRNEGFKTFDSIIDESYDDIENDIERWTAAFEQVKILCNMDQSEVLARARPIIEHNYNHAMSAGLEEVPKAIINNKIQNLLITTHNLNTQ